MVCEKSSFTAKTSHSTSSQHSVDEFVDLVFSVAMGAMVLVGVSFLLKPFLGRVELEGPEEVVRFLEVGAAVDDLVNKVLHGGNAVLAKGVFDDCVVGEGDSLAVALAEASLVDEVSDRLLGGVAISHVGFNLSNHVDGRLVQLDEDAIVELSQSQQLHDFSALGTQFIDTFDPDDEGYLGFGFNKEVTLGFGLSLGVDDSLVGSSILLVILFCIGEGELPLRNSFSLGFGSSLLQLFQ